MKQRLSVLTILTFLFVSGTLFGQLKYGEDFTTSDMVTAVTNVKVAPNMIPTYLEGIKQTWATANEVAKELGHIHDWAIYSSILPASGHYNLTLIIEYESMAQYEKGRTNYAAFEEAWLKKISEEKRDEIVQNYPNMREIVGEYLVRKVDFK